MSEGSNSLFRITVVGAGHVGKSAITVRFIRNKFVEKYNYTIEDSYRKQVEVDGVACVLEVMDTAGQEEFSSLRDQYIQTGEGILLVYSIVSRNSFDSAKKLYRDILKRKGGPESGASFPIVLAGNKSDLVDEREVTFDEGKELAARFGVDFMETSAKTPENVQEAFYLLVRKISKKRAKEAPPKPKKKKGCIIA